LTFFPNFKIKNDNTTANFANVKNNCLNKFYPSCSYVGTNDELVNMYVHNIIFMCNNFQSHDMWEVTFFKYVLWLPQFIISQLTAKLKIAAKVLSSCPFIEFKDRALETQKRWTCFIWSLPFHYFYSICQPLFLNSGS
jgi:hypothetical protein